MSDTVHRRDSVQKQKSRFSVAEAAAWGWLKRDQLIHTTGALRDNTQSNWPACGD